MITRANRNTHILNFQYLSAPIVDKLIINLQQGKSTRALSKTNAAIQFLIDVLYRYVTFPVDPTFAFKFDFVKVTDGDTTVNINIGGTDLGTFDGTASPTEIVTFFYNKINTESSTPEFLAERSGDSLYIYSTDVSLSFASVITVTLNPASPDNVVDYDTTSLEGLEEQILDLKNCLTCDELCDIISLTNTLINNYTNC